MSKNAYIRNATFSDAYLDLDETTIEGQFEQAIEQSVALSVKYEAFNKLVKQMTAIEHNCYECRRPIQVDVSRILRFNDDIRTEEFLCDNHKVSAEVSEKSIPFIKYKNTFLQKLSNRLLESSTQNKQIWETMKSML